MAADRPVRVPGPGAPARPTTVLYIAGAGRSGSTLVERTLATAWGLISASEFRMLFGTEISTCSCGENLDACPVWSGPLAAAGLTAGSDRLNHLRAEYTRLQTRHAPRAEIGALWDRHVAPLSELAPAVADVFTELADAADPIDRPVVVDASKDPLHARLLMDDPRLDVRILHLVRDPRAVAHSWLREKHDPTTGAPMPVWSAHYSTGIWTAMNASAMRLASRVPSARLRFEDFVTDPRVLTPLVSDLVDRDIRLDALDTDTRTVDLPVSHSIGGNPDRFDAGPTTLRVSDDWRTQLSARDRRTADLLSLPLRRLYGYR